MHHLRRLIKDGLPDMRIVGTDKGVKLILENVEINLTNAEIDKIVSVRDETCREMKHRGYPVKG